MECGAEVALAESAGAALAHAGFQVQEEKRAHHHV
jgi:hypothetical protein